jgi:ribosomal protein S18 acetylase RimI-like enzyme
LVRRWTLGAAARRAIEVLKEEGIRALFFRVLGETIYRRVLVVEFPSSVLIPTIQPRVPARIERLEESQVGDYLSFQPDSNRSEIRNRFSQEHWCFVAWDEGQIVAAVWASPRFAKIDYLARQIDLAPHDAYMYELSTLPQFRRAFIGSALVVNILRFSRASGYSRLLAVVVPENKPGWKFLLRQGFRPLGKMGYLKIGPWRREFTYSD